MLVKSTESIEDFNAWLWFGHHNCILYIDDILCVLWILCFWNINIYECDSFDI